MRKETVEEYFLDNIKNVLQFGNDVQAIRFMEKYFEAKQERSYSQDDLELRKRLWVDVYIAYVSTPNSYNRDGGYVWADKALERFDEQFKK